MRKFMIGLALAAATLVAACGDRSTDQKSEAQPERPAATAERQAEPRPSDSVRFQTLQGFQVRTETQRMNCVAAGLAADGLTTAQATNVAVGHQGTINGQKVTFQAGDTYYDLCGGPSAEERLEVVASERAAISSWVYRDVDGARARSNTWAYQAQVVEIRLEERGEQVTALQSQLASAGKADWLQNILILLLVAAVIMALFRDRLFGRSAQRPVQPEVETPEPTVEDREPEVRTFGREPESGESGR